MDQKTINLLFAEISNIKKTLANVVTKDDINNFLTKADAKNFATRNDIKILHKDITKEIRTAKKDLRKEIRNVEVSITLSADKHKADQETVDELAKRVTRLEHKIAA